jgi:hypothetical protein
MDQYIHEDQGEYVRKTGSWSNKIKTNAEIKHKRYTTQ